jgi:hypothetical protein
MIFLLPTTSSKTASGKNKPGNNPRIQAAILLDVSNSMDGLIDQAKAQLWNMVSVMGKAECNNQTPEIQIALYEYGRPTNDARQGYVKKINEFISDLDRLSQNLFSLKTNGGDEFCGHVMYSSLTELNWDTSSTCCKVIFIAGNEDFLQGDIQYTRACEEAKKKGVIVNTIYCGPKMQGITEHWNLGAECGNGSFSNINQNAREKDIPTPYDSSLMTLNEKLNRTYIYYGNSGEKNMGLMGFIDQSNSFRGDAYMKRVSVKGNSKLYNNSTWDVVDANGADSTFAAKVDMKTLPDSLKNKSRAELLEIVKAKSAERAAVQKEIQTMYTQREIYINNEKAKGSTKNNDQTLETEIEKIIREQVKRFNMVIK